MSKKKQHTFDLTDRSFFQALMGAALERSFVESGDWKTVFRQLSFCCNMIDAMLSRSERENLCPLCDYWDDDHYCEAASCVIHHREHCGNFSRS